MPLRKRLSTITITTLICVFLDQITKAVAAAKLPSTTLRFLGDTIRLHYAENQGAFLSLGANLPESTRFLIFTVFSSMVLFALFFYIVYYEKDMPRPQLIVWALMFGGGISNLIDRLFRDGLVRDFLNVGIGNIRTGVFNVADVALTGGVIVLIVQNLWMMKDGEQLVDHATPPVIE